MRAILFLFLLAVAFPINVSTQPLDIQPIKVVDVSGNARGLQVDNNHLHVIAESHGEAVASGIEPGHTPFRIFGINRDVDNLYEDIWVVGGTYVFPPTPGIQVRFVSTSNDDIAGGAGVRTIKLTYLDYPTMDERTEIVTMNGTVGVSTSATNIYRIQYYQTMTAGTYLVASGNIDCVNGSTIYGRIGTGLNLTRKAIWTVPNGKTAYLSAWNAGGVTATGTHYGDFILRSTSTLDGTLTSGIFQIKDVTLLQNGSDNFAFPIPIKIPAKADIKISVISDASNADLIASGHIEGWYENE